MYIYTSIRTFNEDNSILSSFSPLLFFLFFSSFSLCYNGQENVIGTLSLCRCDLGRCVTATFSFEDDVCWLSQSLLSVWENS